MRAATCLAVLLMLPAAPMSAQDAASGEDWDREALEAACEANAPSDADLATCLDIVRRVLAPEPGGWSEEAAFAPFELRGKGAKIVRFDKPEGVALVADISHQGKGPFAVAAMDRDGILEAWLVQDRGRYRGRVLLDATLPGDQPCVAVCEADDSAMFEITAGGRWVITLAPVVSAREWRTAGTLSGDGDDVVRLDAPLSGAATTTVMTVSDGSGLLVWPYAMEDGVRLLDDEPRPEGLREGDEIRLPAGTALLRIRAEGPWSLTQLE